MKKVLFFLLLLSTLIYATTKTTIQFKSLDNVMVAADLYLIDNDINRPMIVLFHQANWSRGEYIEIAPKLNKLGFNCMAVDLRSGDKINGIQNQTYLNAKKSYKKTNHLNSRIDMIASFQEARSYSNKLIGWGSSYSASILLKTIGEKPRYAKAILAFSPGEYFKRVGKPDDYIQKSASKLKIPVFITSSKSEKNSWTNIYEAINSKYRKSFIPTTEGNHGSRVLWSESSNNKAYWNEVESFLRSLQLK